MAGDVRLEKINSEIQKNVSDIINNKLKDPRLSGLITVMKVETAKDLGQAKVFLSIFENDAEKAKQTFECISSSASFIKSELFRMIRIKSVPALVFKLDESLDYNQKILKLMGDIK